MHRVCLASSLARHMIPKKALPIAIGITCVNAHFLEIVSFKDATSGHDKQAQKQE